MNKSFSDIIAYNSMMFNEIFGHRKAITIQDIDGNDFSALKKMDFCCKYDVSGNEYDQLCKEFQEV